MRGWQEKMRPNARRPRIALFGHFGAGNLGNEATLQAMVYNLRRFLPDAEISCICSGPEKTSSEYDIPAVSIKPAFPIWPASGVSGRSIRTIRESCEGVSSVALEPHASYALRGLRIPLRVCAYPFLEAARWLRGISRLRGNDFLVMTGTGMLADHSLQYEIFRWAILAKICRCKLIFISVGGGAIRHPLSRCLIRVALSLADYRSYRDTSSRDHAKVIGIDIHNDPVYPDLAFSLPRTIVPSHHDCSSKAAVIGVGVMNYYGRSGGDHKIYHEYIDRLAAFVIGLLERNYAVRVLIGDFVWDQDVRKDLRKALEHRGVKYEDTRIIDEQACSVDQLLSQMSMVDVVVSSRFHNILLALMLGKPVFAIPYHEKFLPLINGVGLGGFFQDIEQIDVDELIEQVIRLRENAPQITSKLIQQTEHYRLALDQQYRQIIKMFSIPVDRQICDIQPPQVGASL